MGDERGRYVGRGLGAVLLDYGEYFGAVGLGFLFAEAFHLQQLVGGGWHEVGYGYECALVEDGEYWQVGFGGFVASPLRESLHEGRIFYVFGVDFGGRGGYCGCGA